MENLIILPQRKISLFVQVTGLIFFGALFFICWQFYLERMLSFDGAFYVFRFMESGQLSSSPGRYGDYVPEFFALMAFKMNLSLSDILRIYSVIFIVLHYLVFLFVTLVLRNNGAGIAIMLVSCLAYYHAFYLPTVELHESIIFAILLWALIHPEQPYFNKRQKNLALAGAFLTIFCAAYLHPLGIFAIAFVLGVEMIGAQRYRDKQLWAIILLGMGWLFLKFYVISKEQYDQDQVMSFHAMFSNLSNWKIWPSTHFVSDFTNLHFRSLKWIALLFLLLSLRKGILFFLFVLIFGLGYTFIFLANYQLGASPLAYESYYILYGFFAGLIFMFIAYHPERKGLVLILMIPLLWLGVKKIYQAHEMFTDRLHYIGRIVDEAHQRQEKKCLIDSKCYPYDYAMASWNVGFESLLYSSLQGPDSSVTIFIKEPKFDKMCDSAQNIKNVLFGVHFSPLWFTSNDMPDNYLRLPSTGYKYLTHTQNDTSFHEDIYSAQNIRIIPLVQTIHVYVNDDVAAVPIEIINTTGHTIPSIPRTKNPILVSYKFLDEKGKVLFKDVSNPLETDIANKEKCGITFRIPRLKGTYFIKPDIITEGLRWWNIPVEPVKVIID